MEKTYAQALFNLSHAKDANVEELSKKLVEHLQASGRMKLLPHILRELKRIELRSQNLSQTLEVASEEERAEAEKLARELGITATATVNTSLISGWRAKNGGRSIDRSGKRALLDLYRHILTTA